MPRASHQDAYSITDLERSLGPCWLWEGIASNGEWIARGFTPAGFSASSPTGNLPEDSASQQRANATLAACQRLADEFLPGHTQEAQRLIRDHHLASTLETIHFLTRADVEDAGLLADHMDFDGTWLEAHPFSCAVRVERRQYEAFVAADDRLHLIQHHTTPYVIVVRPAAGPTRQPKAMAVMPITKTSQNDRGRESVTPDVPPAIQQQLLDVAMRA